MHDETKPSRVPSEPAPLAETTPQSPPGGGPPPISPIGAAGEESFQSEWERNAAAALKSAQQAGRQRSDQQPQRIGPYRIFHELGRGGMGAVYLAVNDADKFRKRVALKVIKRGQDTDEILKRFELERQVLQALNHPNIARLLGGGVTDDGRPYFAMEYIEGEPIDDYCDTHALPIAARLRLFQKVCAAVDHAHKHLIVHRDLKPGNILVGKDGEPKLLDFGIAKLLNPDLMNVTLATGPDLRLMTPEYASPEQVQGKPISVRSDVYSLGILLYELLTGRRPYQFGSAVYDEVVRIICESEPERPSTAITRVVEVPTRQGKTRTLKPEDIAKTRDGAIDRMRRWLRGDLDNVVLKALEKVADRRYSTPAEFAEDIENFLTNRPVRAQPPSALYRARKFVRRNRFAVAAAGLVMASLVMGFAATWWQWRAAVRAEQKAELHARQLARTIDKFISEAKGALERAEGSLPARRALAATIRAGVGELQQSAAGDSASRRRLAEALLLVGTLEGGATSGNEGDSASATAAYDEALRIRRELLAAEPDNAELQREFAEALIQATPSYATTAQRGLAVQYARDALQLATALHQKSPNNPDANLLLAKAQVVVADASDSAAEREELLNASVSLRQQVARVQPGDADTQRDVSVGLLKRGDLRTSLRRYDEAERDYRDGLAIREKLRDAEKPPTARAQRDVLVAQEKLAGLLFQRSRADAGDGDLDADLAQEMLETLVLDGRDLADNNVGDARLRNDWLRYQRTAADVAYKRGQLNWTLEMVGEIAPLHELEAQRDPDNLAKRLAWAQCCALQAAACADCDLAAKNGSDCPRCKPPTTRRAFECAIREHNAVADALPDDADRRGELVIVLTRFATWLQYQQDARDEAIQHYRAALRHADFLGTRLAGAPAEFTEFARARLAEPPPN